MAKCKMKTEAVQLRNVRWILRAELEDSRCIIFAYTSEDEFLVSYYVDLVGHYDAEFYTDFFKALNAYKNRVANEVVFNSLSEVVSYCPTANWIECKSIEMRSRN